MTSRAYGWKRQHFHRTQGPYQFGTPLPKSADFVGLRRTLLIGSKESVTW